MEKVSKEIKDFCEGKFYKKTTKKDRQVFAEMVINADIVAAISHYLIGKHKEIVTEKDLAKKLNISVKYLNELWSSEKYFTVELLAKIEEVLKCKIKITFK